MHTLKLVVIGSSGVGKTSLRSKFITGKTSQNYRATLGADFITKTMSVGKDEEVMLQIWDTAGQERFSSLSSAFFRGADAALLMFDVNQPKTLHDLIKWWQEFCDRAPLHESDMQDFCCVVVGNKIDLVGDDPASAVSETDAEQLLRQLIPPSSRSSSPELPDELHNELFDSDDDDPMASSQVTVRPPPLDLSDDSSSPPISPFRAGTDSIAIVPNQHVRNSSTSGSPKHRLSKSRSRSSSRYYSGTMTTTHTSLTIYHTPSSSFFDSFHSARASPEPWSSAGSLSSPGSSPNASSNLRRLINNSNNSASTITPSLFARENLSSTAGTSPEDESLLANGIPRIPMPDRGPKLFFTSAITGDSVKEVFEYIGQRVVQRCKYDEQIEARKLHMREASGADTIRLESQKNKGTRPWSKCC
ncbi:ras-domain-containing protein [Mycena floridula]|nr:ras-domain-containing protein [Mycena floridula]